jgi:hypothetical protein
LAETGLAGRRIFWVIRRVVGRAARRSVIEGAEKRDWWRRVRARRSVVIAPRAKVGMW